jgi:alpha-tubulin suppressor-like RCC1 family protein
MTIAKLAGFEKSSGSGDAVLIEACRVAAALIDVISPCVPTALLRMPPVFGSLGLVEVIGDQSIAMVSAGPDSTCWLTTGGAAYCSGGNDYGQLGNGRGSTGIQHGKDSAIPTAVKGGLRFSLVSVGKNHACGLTTNGAAYCWGEGSHGELGNGATARGARPVAVVGGLRFASVTASSTESFTCGLTTSGAAYCWELVGDNDNLQLGNGNTGSSSVPVAVAGGLSFTALSAGGLDVCGVTTDGAAYCWGKGSKLGTGTTKDALTPVPVTGGLNFSSISSGGSVTCGVTTSGAVYCWGNNSYGELGGATTSDRSLVPVAVRMQTDDDGFKAFFREFSAAVRKHDRATIELMLSPKIEFPVEVRSPRMALGYQNGEGWKQLEESVTTGTKPHKDSSPQPVTRVTNDNWVLFARGSDGKWRWLRFGIPSLF